MNGATLKWIGRTAGVSSAALVLAACTVYYGSGGGVAHFYAAVLAVNLLLLACAAALAWAICLFATTPAGRRRRPIRRQARVLLGHFSCVTCVLLCVGVCALWVASCRQAFGAVFFNGAAVDYAVASKRNYIVFGTEPRPRHRKPVLSAGDMLLGSVFPRREMLHVPHAAFAVGFALPAVVWILRCRRAATAERGHDIGHCPACGYDLRASLARCPECGTLAKKD